MFYFMLCFIEGLSCAHILKEVPNSKSGFYNTWFNDKVVSVYCDMETDGGRLTNIIVILN